MLITSDITIFEIAKFTSKYFCITHISNYYNFFMILSIFYYDNNL